MIYENFLEINKNVSRETFEKLKIYHITLLKWQKKYNLIAESTISNSWHRHFVDSAQITNHLDILQTKKIIDLGSGAGFPGAVISILTNIPTLLVEENYKKVNFLNEIKILTDASFEIIQKKIEKIKNLKTPFIVCRALKPLNQLLEYSQPLLAKNGYCLFLKGKRASEEIIEAEKYWSFIYEKIPSVTDCQSHILRVKQIERKK